MGYSDYLGLGIFAELGGWYVVDVDAGNFSLIPSFKGVEDIIPPSVAPTFFKFDFSYVSKNFIDFAVIVFAFLVDLFDTVGTLIGSPAKATFR